jgi:hypothetical protein
MQHQPAEEAGYQDPLLMTGVVNSVQGSMLLVRYGPRDLARPTASNSLKRGGGHVHAPPAGRTQG